MIKFSLWLLFALLVSSQHETNSLISTYTDEIAANPSSFLPLFKRAAIYIQHSRPELAATDLSLAVKLNPGFVQAKLQLVKVLLSLCRLDEAKKMLGGMAASEEVDALLKEADDAREETRRLMRQKGQERIDTLTKILNVCSSCSIYRKDRAETYISIGDTQLATADYSRLLLTTSSPLPILHTLSTLLANQNHLSQSLDALRTCLKHDMDDSFCKKRFKLVKKIQKILARFDGFYVKEEWGRAVGVSVGEGFLKEIQGAGVDALVKDVTSRTCYAYGNMRDHTGVFVYCPKAIALNEEDALSIMYLAESTLEKGDFEESTRLFGRARDIDPNSNRIQQGQQKSKRLLKQSQKKDYYKMLGVDRTASKRDIKRAFRKLATIWHPDKYRGEMGEKEVEKKMSDINQAYQVLSDDTMREQFDNGQDPFDPEQHQGGGGGFHQGHHPFFQQQGSPFHHQQQEFHFNF